MINKHNILMQIVINPSKKINLAFNLLILCLSLTCGYIVYKAGGTHKAYVHIIYIPIIMSGFCSGISYGILQGFLAGLIMGPYMPDSTTVVCDQGYESWIFRTFFFALIGGLSGIFSTVSRSYHSLRDQQYLYDAVTNLPNYRGLVQWMQKHNNTHYDYSGAIAIKIKQYVDINRAFGPKVSEELLIKISQQLKVICNNIGLVGRLENNQFIIILNKGVNIADIITKCRQSLSQEYTLDNINVFVELHYGFAASAGALDLNDLLRQVDNAVVRSIENKVVQACYDKNLDERSEENIFIIHALNNALSNHELKLFYQPKVDLQTRKIVGLEALIRWYHPTRGFIAPDVFILTLEKTLLINSFSKWVINESMTQLSAWHQLGIAVPLSINLSMVNFDDPSVINKLLEQIKTHQIPTNFVEVELTESALTSNITRVADILKNLQAQGLKIAIDDFGTGLSSLNYLFELPVDILKIDQVFINAMIDNSAAEAIVRSAIKLGQELNLTVIAEGIENEQQMLALAQIGCHVGQGYHLGRPMPVEEITECLRNRKI